MVGHQAIGQNINPMLGTIGRQPSQIGSAVVVREKHDLATVTPLSDVMGGVGKDRAGVTVSCWIRRKHDR